MVSYRVFLIIKLLLSFIYSFFFLIFIITTFVIAVFFLLLLLFLILSFIFIILVVLFFHFDFFIETKLCCFLNTFVVKYFIYKENLVKSKVLNICLYFHFIFYCIFYIFIYKKNQNKKGITGSLIHRFLSSKKVY